jgi:hypothetical protein
MTSHASSGGQDVAAGSEVVKPAGRGGRPAAGLETEQVVPACGLPGRDDDSQAGVYETRSCLLTPDGQGYARSYGRVLNDVFLLEGLRF